LTVTGSGSSLTNSGLFYIGGAYTNSIGTLTIKDGGVVNTDTVNIATYFSSTGTLNIGAAEGQTAVAAGTLNAAKVVFGEGNGTLVFNHTNANYDFSAAISSEADTSVKLMPNYGTINQIAGFTTLSGDSSGFYGTTNVTGGTLNVTGTLGGTLNVSNTGTLSGYGDIGTTNILSGGTLSPGGSGALGVLYVNGDLTFESGSTYAVDLRGTENNQTRGSIDSDRTSVSGDVTINGGTVSVTALDASTSYLSGKTYNVIYAEGTLSGAFTNVVSGSAFLTTTASYDANNAYVTIEVKDTSSGLFAPVAQTSNQLAVARSLDTLSQSDTSLELYNAMLMLSEDEARTAYQQLSGDSYATAQAAFLHTVQSVNNTVNTRMRSITQSVEAPSITPLGYAEEDDKIAKKDNPFSSFEKKEKTFDSQRFSAWTMGFGSWGKVNGSGGGLDTNTGNGGVLFGVDGLVSNAWRVGVMGGYSHSSFDTAASNGSSDNYHVGVYGTGEWGAVAVRSGLNYAWSDVDNTRQVSLLSQTLKGNYDAGSLSAFTEVGYTIKIAAANFEPFASLSYSHVKTDGFSETGGSAALTVTDQTMNTTFTTIGLRTSKDVDLLGTAAALRGTAGWVHAFGDVDTISTARFATGDSFTVSGTPIDRDAALLEAGLDLNLTAASTFSLGYTGQIGKNAYEHGANAKFRVQF
jgi:outer membrane autotransporter protein